MHIQLPLSLLQVVAAMYTKSIRGYSMLSLGPKRRTYSSTDRLPQMSEEKNGEDYDEYYCSGLIGLVLFKRCKGGGGCLLG